jgi:PleD family two-component response regulator
VQVLISFVPAQRLPRRRKSTMKRILIVEDQAEIRDLIRMTLEMGDFEIHEVVDVAPRNWRPTLSCSTS